MNTSLVSIAACAAFVAAHASAQQVWPKDYGSRAGGSAQNAPFTVYDDAGRSARALTMIRAWTLPFGSNTTISEIAFRRDAIHSGASYSSQTGHVKMQLGRAKSHAIDFPTTSFDENFAGTPTIVFTERRVGIVPQASAPRGVASFDLRIPLKQPWVYSGGDLVVDVDYSGDAAGVWRRDAVHVPAGDPGRFSMTGSGCVGSDGMTPTNIVYPETAVPGGQLTFALYGAKKHSGGTPDIAISLFGLDTGSFFGVSLPFHLASVGFPKGCWLAAPGEFQQTVATQATASGFGYSGMARAEARYPLPRMAALTGVAVSSQWLCADQGLAASVKFTVSNPVRVTLGDMPSSAAVFARTIWAYDSASPSGHIASGSYAPVIQFR